MSVCNIRAISISDLPQLQKIGKTTFAETFTEHNTKEDLDKYLEENKLPNEFKYFDPTKALENRECGLHA